MENVLCNSCLDPLVSPPLGAPNAASAFKTVESTRPQSTHPQGQTHWFQHDSSAVALNTMQNAHLTSKSPSALHIVEEGLHSQALTCLPGSFPVSFHATSVPAMLSQQLFPNTGLSLLHSFAFCLNVILPCPFYSEMRFVLQLSPLL